MTRDLGDQRRGRAAAARIVAMARGQVVADGRLQAFASFQIGAQPDLAAAERIRKHGLDQILLGFEVVVEGAVGQPGARHDAGNADRGNAALAKLR